VFAEWPTLTANVVHALRLNAATTPTTRHHRARRGVQANLAGIRDPVQDQTVAGLTRMFKVFIHPEAGRIELTYQTFDVRDAPASNSSSERPHPGPAAPKPSPT